MAEVMVVHASEIGVAPPEPMAKPMAMPNAVTMTEPSSVATGHNRILKNSNSNSVSRVQNI